MLFSVPEMDKSAESTKKYSTSTIGQYTIFPFIDETKNLLKAQDEFL